MNFILDREESLTSNEVGNTPIVKVSKLSKHCCNIYAKCEFKNPTGSHNVLYTG